MIIFTQPPTPPLYLNGAMILQIIVLIIIGFVADFCCFCWCKFMVKIMTIEKAPKSIKMVNLWFTLFLLLSGIKAFLFYARTKDNWNKFFSLAISEVCKISEIMWTASAIVKLFSVSSLPSAWAEVSVVILKINFIVDDRAWRKSRKTLIVIKTMRRRERELEQQGKRVGQQSSRILFSLINDCSQ